MFFCRPVLAQQIHVKNAEYREQHHEDQKRDRDHRDHDQQRRLRRPPRCQEYDKPEQKQSRQEAQRDYKQHEVAVIPLAHAVVHKRTVVVEILNAAIAVGAVRVTRTSVDLAGGAVVPLLTISA